MFKRIQAQIYITLFAILMACTNAQAAKVGEDVAVYNSTFASPSQLTVKQVGIWLPIVFFLIVIGAVSVIYGIDDVKNRDTILYAKFIANLKDKQN